MLRNVGGNDGGIVLGIDRKGIVPGIGGQILGGKHDHKGGGVKAVAILGMPGAEDQIQALGKLFPGGGEGDGPLVIGGTLIGGGKAVPEHIALQGGCQRPPGIIIFPLDLHIEASELVGGGELPVFIHGGYQIDGERGAL